MSDKGAVESIVEGIVFLVMAILVTSPLWFIPAVIIIKVLKG